MGRKVLVGLYAFSVDAHTRIVYWVAELGKKACSSASVLRPHLPFVCTPLFFLPLLRRRSWAKHVLLRAAGYSGGGWCTSYEVTRLSANAFLAILTSRF